MYNFEYNMRILGFTFLMLLIVSFVNAEELPTIAVVDFTSSGRTVLATKLPEILIDELINSGKFDVVEREKLATVMLEQGFQSSGSVSIGTAVDIGRMLGARYLIMGHVIDFGSEERSFNGYGVNTQTTLYRLKVSVRAIDTESGKIVFSTKKDAEEKEYESQAMQVGDSALVIKLAETISGEVIKEILLSDVFGRDENSSKQIVKITIISEPKRADVEINGVFYGNAGSTFEVPVGLHPVTVSLPGYEIWHKKVMFKDNLKFNVKLMEKKDTKIEVEIRQ